MKPFKHTSRLEDGVSVGSLGSVAGSDRLDLFHLPIRIHQDAPIYTIAL
jgi:hypothetical protein